MSEIDWSKAPHWADRVVKTGVSDLWYWANNQQREMVKNHKLLYADDTHIRDNWEVVARRPISNTVRVNARIAPVETWYPIEQRIASLRALEKQVEETRAELTRYLETLGLTWGEPEQPTITDWRDLRVGDVIECVGDWEGEKTNGKQFSVTKLEPFHSVHSMPIQIMIDGIECPETWGGKFRFIRRP